MSYKNRMKVMQMKVVYLLIMPVLLFSSCSGGQSIEPGFPRDTDTKIDIDIKHNFVFSAINNFIDRPENDRRVFYRVFINKEEYGRTTTGLESQRKIYETNLSVNRHLLSVEKWILNNNEEYVKANNIFQPRPDFVYFDIVENRITNVVLHVNDRGQYEFLVDISR